MLVDVFQVKLQCRKFGLAGNVINEDDIIYLSVFAMHTET